MATRQVQHITVVNEGAYIMSFGLEAFEGGELRIVDGVDTGNYPVAQSRTIDLSTTGIGVGTFVRPLINVVAGYDPACNRFVQYAQNGQVATYEATGITIRNECHLVGP